MNDNIKAIADIIRHNYDVNRRMDINDIILVTAVALDRAGYRKQSDTVKEFAEKALKVVEIYKQAKATKGNWSFADLEYDIKQIAASFGGEGKG